MSAVIETTSLAGSARPRPKTHKFIAPVAPETIIGITLVIRPHPGAPAMPSLADWQATPLARRKFLTSRQFAASYGAQTADLHQVAAFAKSHGLTVLESHAGRRHVVLQGTAETLNAAFGITLNEYEAPVPPAAIRARRAAKSGKSAPAIATYRHHGFDGHVTLPHQLAGLVEAVVGLDNRRLSVPAGGSGDPANSNYLAVSVTAGLYNFPNTGAADQTIGVHAPGTAAYLHSDITGKYFPNQSNAAYKTAPAALNDISLNVGGTVYSNNTAAVQGITSIATADNFILELIQDIATSATIAQGATVNVYFTEDSEAGWLVFLNRVLLPNPGESQPTVITSSFPLALDDSSGSIGSLSDSGSIVSQMTTLFQSLALLGVQVFIALGDWGSDDTFNDKGLHVSYPSSDPWVTSCGGTVIGNVNNGPPAIFSEYVWSDAHSATSGFGNSTSDFGATGGGVSATFPAPPYQTAAGITGATDSAGNFHAGRALPDVAGMVGHTGSGGSDWYYANGLTYNYVGTSCVAPLYAGLAAVLRSSLQRAIGPLNTAIYNLPESDFNDITFGNNDSVDTPDSPYFTAGPGWDACTGLGSLDGTKLLKGITSLLYNPAFYFQVNKGSFGLDEVSVTSSYPNPLWLVLEGFSPKAWADASQTLNVEVVIPGITVTVGAAQPELKSQPDTVQRLLFPCAVSFATSAIKDIANGGIFPNPGNTTPTQVVLASEISFGGLLQSAETILELEAGADPYFANFDATGENPFYLSQDLRVFTVTPGVNKAPIDGIALNAASTTSFDTQAGYQYIQKLLAHLNSTYGSQTGTDPFTKFPDQSNALTGDSYVAPTNGNGQVNYNFAVARVRLSGQPNSSSGPNVRVLFRVFAAETSDTDFQPLTYPSTLDAAGQPLAPELGAGNVTIPFFATGNFQANADFGANTDYSGNSINNQPVQIGASGEIWAYYGCYLNIYPANNTINGQAVQTLLPSTHSCLVAQLVYDNAPMPTGAGVVQGPEWSSNFAQRNLQITASDNPGPEAAHRVPQTFDIRPGPVPAIGTGTLLDYPDELMIDWGNTPAGAKASIFWPQVRAADVLDVADRIYATHQLSAADANTIAVTVPKGFTFVPVLPGTGENFAGLFTIDLPLGVKSGQEFTISVRRITTRRAQIEQPAPPPPQPQARRANDVRDPGKTTRNWRVITGTFAVKIPVTTSEKMLPVEDNTYSIIKWRLDQMQTSNRWVPVLQRYLGIVEGRISGLGGDPAKITPSPTGIYWRNPVQPVHGHGHGHGHGKTHDHTGKIEGIIYDRFGDFEGFLLLTEHGEEILFRTHESEIEELVRFAWEDRIAITVVTDHHDPERPVSIILRRPHPRRLN
jgi:hypothetical protein